MVSLSISSCSLLVLQNSEGLRSILASRDDTLLFYILLCCLLIYALLKWRFSSDMIMYGKSIRNAVLFKRYHTQKLFGFTLPLFLLLGLASIVFGLLAYIYFRFTPIGTGFCFSFFSPSVFSSTQPGYSGHTFCVLHTCSFDFSIFGDNVFVFEECHAFYNLPWIGLKPIIIATRL